MTTHGEFLHKAITNQGWQFFDGCDSYAEFIQQQVCRDLSSSTNAAEAAAECVQAIKDDYRTAKLSPRNRAMLNFTRKLAAARRELGPEDLDALRSEGFNEHQI